MSKNLFTVFWLLIQNWISTKMNFLASLNRNQKINSSCFTCLSTNFCWNWWMASLTNLIGKPAKRCFCLIVSFPCSKFLFVWQDRIKLAFITFLLYHFGTFDVQCIDMLLRFPVKDFFVSTLPSTNLMLKSRNQEGLTSTVKFLFGWYFVWAMLLVNQVYFSFLHLWTHESLICFFFLKKQC